MTNLPSARTADLPFIDFAFPVTGQTINRTMPDRLAEVKNVMDFNAKGDGSTDDWQAIQNAVNWTAGLDRGTIYFPPGTYNVSQPITFNYNGNLSIRFVGEGTRSAIAATFSGPGYVFDRSLSSPSNTTGLRIFERLRVVANNGAAPFTGAAGCIRLGSTDGGVVRDCQLEGGVGVTTEDAPGQSSVNVAVENCVFAATGDNGVRQPGSHAVIMGGPGTIINSHVQGRETAFRLYGQGIVCIANETEAGGNDAGEVGAAYLLGVDSAGIDQGLSGFAITSASIERWVTGIDFMGTCDSFWISGCIHQGEQGPGASSYGIRVRANKAFNGVFASCWQLAYFTQAAWDIEPATNRANLYLMSCQGSCSAGGGVPWILPTNAWTAWFEQCLGATFPPLWTYSQLPSGTDVVEGDEFTISDGLLANMPDGDVWGGRVTGGTGTLHRLVRWNGTNYTVVGK